MQKFECGDVVRVAKDLGSLMSHFESGCVAIVVGSYEDECLGEGRLLPEDKSNFGDPDEQISYTLFLRGTGEISWYHQNQLTLIKKGCANLLTALTRESHALHGELRAQRNLLISGHITCEEYQAWGKAWQKRMDELQNNFTGEEQLV